MANTKRKRGGRITVVRAHGELALSTLADNATLSAAMFGAAVEGSNIFMISADLLLSLKDHTPAEGPVFVGCAHGDYTDAEITENLQADTLDRTDKIVMERAGRQVREWGIFPGGTQDEVLNDGRMLRVRIRIMLQNDVNLNIWAHNFSGAPLTTGSVLGWTGKAFCRLT